MPRNSALKVVPFEQLSSLVIALEENKNLSFVTTNGCFDIITPGHISLLQEAKRKGDVLIVGINSDASIRRLKGPTRPVMNEGERLLMLSALECVDFVTVIDSEDIMKSLIEAVDPDFHVMGADHEGKRKDRSFIKKMDVDMIFLDVLPDLSMSDIVRRIKNMDDDGKTRSPARDSSCPHCGGEIKIEVSLRGGQHAK